jgi:hypothetical protein
VTMDRAAAVFREGAAIGFERISKFATSDLGDVVEIERFRSKLDGADELGPTDRRESTYQVDGLPARQLPRLTFHFSRLWLSEFSQKLTGYSRVAVHRTGGSDVPHKGVTS